MLPKGVDVKLDSNKLEVKGPKGTLKIVVKEPITVKKEGDSLVVVRPDDARENRALHGLTRALISNMVEGVSKGFEKRLIITGVGYRASMDGKKLNLALGFSHPVHIEPNDGITFEISKTQTDVTVKGIDKALVGQVAANIRKLKESEPYKGKGIRYEDEVIRRKAGKSVSGGK